MFELRDGLSTADTDYGMVLLDEHSGQYWSLNPTALLALQTLLAGGTVQNAAEKLAAQYDINLASARQDIDALVGEMLRARLLKQGDTVNGSAS